MSTFWSPLYFPTHLTSVLFLLHIIEPTLLVSTPSKITFPINFSPLELTATREDLMETSVTGVPNCFISVINSSR